MTQRRVKLFGPPGTGKTEALLRRILSFREETGCAADRVGFVTFTRTAREEALSRLGAAEDTWPWVRTLHSLCYRGLALSSSRMVGKQDLQRFAAVVGVEISEGGESQADEEVFTELPVGDQLLRLNHLGRHRRLKLLEAIKVLGLDLDEQLAAHFTRTYRQWKDAEGLLDYTDLLTRYLDRGGPLPVDLFIVDEAQDLSPLQWEVAERMGATAREFVVAGDDDQAIYSWAGATADLFIHWRADDVEVLHQSYRLPRQVWDKVQEVAGRIESRQEKQYLPRDDEGEAVYTGLLPEFRGGGAAGEALVLYRYGHRGKQLAKELRSRAVPFQGTFSPLSNKQVRLALQALRGNVSRECLEAARFLSPKTQTPSSVYDLSRAYYHDYICQVFEDVGLDVMLTPGVVLSSIHQAKGRQARIVVLDTSMSRSSYEHLQQDPDDEHRVWYVGASRARETLVILESGMGRYNYEL